MEKRQRGTARAHRENRDSRRLDVAIERTSRKHLRRETLDALEVAGEFGLNGGQGLARLVEGKWPNGEIQLVIKIAGLLP
jgi:hypothetical protein